MLRAFSVTLLLSLFTAPALANDLEHTLQAGFDSGKLDGLHSVLVRRNGETLAEVYFDGDDYTWDKPLGNRAHGPDTLHDMRSISKSIVGLLYGIALAKGLVPPVDTALISKFPEYSDLATPERAKITIADTLSMQMGIKWNEDLPYTNRLNSEIAMELAPDRYRYVLEQPVTGTPGKGWTYNGGATALIAEIITRGSGMPIDAFAATHLFTPLGIARYEWIKGDDGIPAAASGLRLTTRDLARIGEMVAAWGIYNGQQIVPRDWLETALSPHAKTKGQLRYGYQWWLAPRGNPPNWVAAFGNGGQRLTVVPGRNLVGAITAGNYDDPDGWKIPVSVIQDYIVPALGLD